MNVNCYCGKGYELPQKQKKYLLVGLDAFCSGECLYELLVAEGTLESAIIEIENDSLISKSMMEVPSEYWCKETKKHYRSKSEATFARWCNANGIDWEYEPYTIQLNDRQTYTPDFWLPEFYHFAEVKGAWSGSGKKKVRKTKELGFNIVLVSDDLIRKLHRARIGDA